MQDCTGALDCFSQSEDEADSRDQGVVVIGSAEADLSNKQPLSHDISDTDTATVLAEHRTPLPIPSTARETVALAEQESSQSPRGAQTLKLEP
jgi:hypothetical protein